MCSGWKKGDDFGILSAMTKITPAIEQFLRTKAEHPDCIIFFRMGDFYEMFFEDAKVASKEMGIALTSRGKHRGEDVPLCGVPYHAADEYIAILLSKGYKVAICEQIEDPKQAKGIVKRAVTRVITPGTVLDPQSLGKIFHSILASMVSDGAGRFGLAQVDFSTGEFKCTELAGVNALFDELGRIDPKELVAPEGLFTETEFKHRWDEYLNALVDEPLLNKEDDSEFEFEHNYKRLCQHFGVESLFGFGLDQSREAVRASGALLGYLESTQLREQTPSVEIGGGEPARLEEPLSHITDLRYYTTQEFMVLDEATKRNLELVKTLREGKERGSLFNLINLCVTPMGSRTLLDWVNYPLMDLDKINQRLDAVALGKDEHALRLDLRNLMNRISDLERLASRVSMKSANARDLLGIKQSLKVLPAVKELLAGLSPELFKDIHSRLDPLAELAELLEQSISEEAPLVLHEGRLIKKGFNAELDELTTLQRDARAYLARIESSEREKTKIPSLKVGYNRVFGYYIEITKPHLHLAPDYFQRRQTLVNAERFITPELKELEAKILTAEDRIIELNYELFCGVREEVAKHSQTIRKNAREIGTLDSVISLAELAGRRNYCRPELDLGDTIEIKGGRHPVIEALRVGEQFIPNDCRLDNSDHQILIITGPNMAGKSTVLRQVGLIVLLAQIGSFVPAESAKLSLVDRIFTRVGASDVLARGLSTFMVEMIETAQILRYATHRSLVLLDEIGRGTSTFDGLSIAWAVVEYLHDQPEHQAKTLFATHFHELVDLEQQNPRVKNYHIAVKEWQGEVIFIRKLLRGGTSRSYGIQVARLSGIPQTVIDRAKEILANLELTEFDKDGQPMISRGKNAGKKEKSSQPNLFSVPQDPDLLAIEKELKKLELETLSPLEALNLVWKWRKKFKAD
jgi:DNA mismatch repair protein MutS